MHVDSVHVSSGFRHNYIGDSFQEIDPTVILAKFNPAGVIKLRFSAAIDLFCLLRDTVEQTSGVGTY